MKKIIVTLIALVTLSTLSFSSAYAQTDATIILSPKNPEPKSFVTLEIESYSFNVNTATITWEIGGKVILQGQGETILKLRTGNVGESSVVTVTSDTAGGLQVKQSITITPSSVVLLYEAPKSYVPLLYEGRSLPSTGASVRVSALPSISDSGVLLSPSNLSYSWYVNDSFVKSISGKGKQSATIELDYLKNSTDIKVLIQSPLGNRGEKTITIYPHPVMPILYKYDSILGTNFTQAIERRFEAVSDFTLSLEPFYVSNEDNKPATYTWYLDGLPATPAGGRILGLAPKANSYGSKLLKITVLGSNKRLQKSELTTELIFDTRK